MTDPSVELDAWKSVAEVLTGRHVFLKLLHYAAFLKHQAVEPFLYPKKVFMR